MEEQDCKELLLMGGLVFSWIDAIGCAVVLKLPPDWRAPALSIMEESELDTQAES